MAPLVGVVPCVQACGGVVGSRGGGSFLHVDAGTMHGGMGVAAGVCRTLKGEGG